MMGEKKKMKEKRLGTTHKDKFKRIFFTFFTQHFKRIKQSKKFAIDGN